MTVIYFLYLFAFIEMLPPRDLGLVMLKSQETEPAGPLPHHPSPAACVPHTYEGNPPLSDGAQRMQRWKPISFISHLWAQRSPISFPAPLPREGFYGLRVGQTPPAPSPRRLRGESGNESCQGKATGTLLGQGYGRISRSSSQQRT